MMMRMRKMMKTMMMIPHHRDDVALEMVMKVTRLKVMRTTGKAIMMTMATTTMMILMQTHGQARNTED